MKGINRLSLILVMAALVAACSGHVHRSSDSLAVKGYGTQNPLMADGKTTRPAASEIEARLMSYADRYLSKVAEATDLYQRAVPTKASRELGLATFIFPGLTVIGIASGGEPGPDLLDMVVFASLQRESLENGWAREILGDHAEPLLQTQRQLEAQAWDIARDVLSDDQMDRLRNAILAWRKMNPKQRYVANVKFDDVAASRGQDQTARGLEEESSGLLAPLDAAVREGEEIRLMAKRSMYVIQRMPPLLLAQARFVLNEEVSPEQIDGLLKDISGFRTAVEKAQKNLDQLPELLDKERKAVFHDLDTISPLLTEGQTLTRDLKALFVTIQDIESHYPATGAVINETLREYRQLAEIMDRSPPSDLGPKIELLRELAHVGSELNQLADTFQRKPVSDRMNDVLNGILFRAMVFVLFVFVLALLYRRYSRILDRR